MTTRRIITAAATGIIVGLAFPHSAQSDFAGPYLGSHVGGNFSAFEIEGDFDNGSPTAYELDPNGWTAGIHAGVNIPYQGALIGIEAAYSAANDVATHPVGIGAGSAADDFASYAFNDTVTLTARFGFVIAPRYFPFVKVGIAWADIEGQSGDTDGAPPALDDDDVVRPRGWETGFVLGAGLEVLWATNWSVRAEYEYMDFGSAVIVNSEGDINNLKIQNHAVKFGVSRHF